MPREHLIDPEVLRAAAERLRLHGPQPWKPKTPACILRRFEFHDDVVDALGMFVRTRFKNETQMPITDEAIAEACRYVDENGRLLHDDQTIENAYRAMAAGTIPFPYRNPASTT